VTPRPTHVRAAGGGMSSGAFAFRCFLLPTTGSYGDSTGAVLFLGIRISRFFISPRSARSNRTHARTNTSFPRPHDFLCSKRSIGPITKIPRRCFRLEKALFLFNAREGVTLLEKLPSTFASPIEAIHLFSWKANPIFTTARLFPVVKDWPARRSSLFCAPEDSSTVFQREV